MKVKVLKDSVRYKKHTYSIGQEINDFPEDEALRLKETGHLEILEITEEKKEETKRSKDKKSNDEKGE